MILAGDVGGTKCNIALVEAPPGSGEAAEHARAEAGAGGAVAGAARDSAFRIAFLRRYPSQNYAQFADVIAEFLHDARKVLEASGSSQVLAAGFGVAGPVIGRSVRVTNVHWSVDAAALESQLDTRHVVLLNDLEATGYSLAWLPAADMFLLNPGNPAPRAPQALLAAGTGLGESILHWDGERYAVFPSEGGHTDFAPRTEQEIELLRYMKKTNKFVSWELVVSGRGFRVIHEFLNANVRHASFAEPGADPAQEITRRGLDGSCEVCVRTLDLWTALYGAEAGNLALKALARGGVFVAGGIAPKILPKMKDGTFLRAFCEKENFADLLAAMPVQIVLNQDAPLLGAAAEAWRAHAHEK
jgi:glucokinase